MMQVLGAKLWDWSKRALIRSEVWCESLRSLDNRYWTIVKHNCNCNSEGLPAATTAYGIRGE